LRSTVIVIFGIALNSILFGQEITDKPFFESYDNTKGLSHLVVHDIVQDQQGFLWIATEEGLNRFDGYNFKVFYKDGEGFTDDFIYSLFEKPNGNFLVGTNNKGIIEFDPQTHDFSWISEDFIGPAGSNRIESIEAIDSFNYLIGSYRGVYVYNDSLKTIKPIKDKGNLLHSISVNYMIKIDSVFWIFSNTGIYTYNVLNKRSALFLDTYYHKTFKSDNRFMSAAPLNEDSIFVGTTYGLYVLNTKNQSFNQINLPTTNPNQPHTFYDLELYNNVLWGGSNFGLYKIEIELGTITQILPEASVQGSLTNKEVATIFLDKNQNIWLGTIGSGLNKMNLKPPRFKLYRNDPAYSTSFSSNTIRALFADSKNNIWVSPLGYTLNKYNRETHKVVQYSPHINKIQGSVISIYEDSQNNIWFGTWDHGAFVMALNAPEKYINYKHIKSDSNSLQFNRVHCFLEDSEGNMWIGTETGLDVLSKNRTNFRHFVYSETNQESIASGGVQFNSIQEDLFGNFWVGTWGGITHFKRNREKENAFNDSYTLKRMDHLLQQHGINDVRIISMCYDEALYPHKIFAGTYGTGLLVINLDSLGSPKNIENYTRNDGLSNNVLYSLFCDQEGNLWMSTNKGITCFNPSTKLVKTFNHEDGLQNDQFFWGAACQSKTGELFFGGVDGFNSFYPNDINNDTIAPELLFTDFRIFNKSIEVGQAINKYQTIEKDINKITSLTLLHGQKVISFEISSDYFERSGALKFQYMLEGFDEVWFETDANNRIITYTNLAPGNYIFRAKASNPDGIWSAEKTMQIHVRPPYWLTWWFRASVIAFIILGSISFYFYRISSIKNKNKHLEQLVGKRTLEIKRKNKLLEEQAKNLLLSKNQLEERQQQIMEQAEELRVQADVLNNQKNELEKVNTNLAEANATKDKFFSIIAHDLKNPFSIVQGYAELMLIKHDKLSKERRTSLLKSIYSSVQSVNKLLENLLQWSRSQTNRITIKPEYFHADSMISEIVFVLQGNLQKKNIKIKNNLDAEIQVFADYNMVSNVFLNVLTNAIKFTPKKGEITVSSSNSDHYTHFFIKDSGQGISENMRGKLFKIEHAYSENGTDGETGTGLGLILCKEFMLKNKGDINIDSETGSGTTVEIILPRHPMK
jgi:signal transduction histidine kinase/ligand-binding sensor domain-containing protein